MRVRYTTRRKLALLTMVKCLRDEEGISLRKPAEHVQVSAGLLVKWEERFSLGNDPIEALLKTKKKSIHPLKPLEEALLKYIFEKREQGIEISTLAISLWWRQTSPPSLAKRTSSRGAVPSSAL
jgi:hypothetical protein